MPTPTTDITTESSDTPTIAPATPARGRPSGRPGLSRRRAFALVAAALLAAGAIATLAVDLLGDDAAPPEPAGAPLELSLGDGPSLGSCMPFDVDILAEMSPAFAGTATEVTDGAVTLQVDRWYTGGDAATVHLTAPHGMVALISGFDFEVGQQYLITAANGAVNYCGFSGPATPEMTAAFDQAFGG